MKRTARRKKKEIKKSYFIGIDPGAGGAICVLDENGKIVFIWDYPQPPKEKSTFTKSGKKKKKKKVLMLLPNYHLFKNHLFELGLLNIFDRVYIALEKVHEIPIQSGSTHVGGMFNFGANWGAWQITIASLFDKFKEPTPATWQKDLFKEGDAINGNKKYRSISVARRLWPENYEYFKNLGYHNRADAALIARWLWINHKEIYK